MSSISSESKSQSEESRFSTEDPFLQQRNLDLGDDAKNICNDDSSLNRAADPPSEVKVIIPIDIFLILRQKVGSHDVAEGKGMIAEQLKHWAIVSCRNVPRSTINSTEKCAVARVEQQTFIFGQWHKYDGERLVVERMGYYSERHGYCIAYWIGEPKKKYKSFWRIANVPPSCFDWKPAMFKECMDLWDKDDLPPDKDMGWLERDGITFCNIPTTYDSFTLPTMQGSTRDTNPPTQTEMTKEQLITARNHCLVYQRSFFLNNRKHTERGKVAVGGQGNVGSEENSSGSSSEEREFEIDDAKLPGGQQSDSPLKSYVCGLIKTEKELEHEWMLQKSSMIRGCEDDGHDALEDSDDKDTLNSESSRVLKTDSQLLFDECAEEVSTEQAAEEQRQADAECIESEPSYHEKKEMERRMNKEIIQRRYFENVPRSAMSKRNQKSLAWLESNCS